MNCPNCGTELNEEFGLETCKSCGVVAFIDMEGNITLPSEDSNEDDLLAKNEENTDLLPENETPANAENSLPESPPSPPPLPPNPNLSPPPLPNLDSLNSEVKLKLVEPFDDNTIPSSEPRTDVPPQEEHESFPEEAASTPEPLPINTPPLNENLSLKPKIDDLPQCFPQEEHENFPGDSPTPEPEPTSADTFLDEIQLFGDLDSEVFQKADYFFDLTISEINTKDTRDQMIESLSDKRLTLDLSVISKIKNGTLVIPNLPAIRAMAVLHAISHLPCKVSWIIKENFELSKPAEDIEGNEDHLEENMDNLEEDIGEYEDFENLEEGTEEPEENLEGVEEDAEEV